MSEVKAVRVVKTGKDEQGRDVWELQIELPDERAMNWRWTTAGLEQGGYRELVYLGEGPLKAQHFHPDIYSVTVDVESTLEAFRLLVLESESYRQTGRFDGYPMRYFIEQGIRIQLCDEWSLEGKEAK